jgi:hypothetical protein
MIGLFALGAGLATDQAFAYKQGSKEPTPPKKTEPKGSEPTPPKK